MSLIKDKLIAEIEKQQKRFKEFEPPYTVGEQLKDIGAESDSIADILYADLQNEQMNLSAAADMLQDYADKNHGRDKKFCITPKKADELLRDFYKLPSSSKDNNGEGTTEPEPFVNLADFF